MVDSSRLKFDPTDPDIVDPDYISGQQTTRYMDQGQYTRMIDVQNTLIGRGLRDPGTFSKQTGKVLSNGGVARLNQSIYQILSTRVGERFFVPAFGSNLYKYIFEPNTLILQDLVSAEIKRSLAAWEKRIEVVAVTCNADGNWLYCEIEYKVLKSNQMGNYTYPINKELYGLSTGNLVNEISQPNYNADNISNLQY